MVANLTETNDESMCDVAFHAAVDIIQNVPEKGPVSISASQKLRLYSLFKQGVTGKCDIPCPPFWHTFDRLKWRAWNSLGSMDSMEAKKAYVAELKNIINSVRREYDIIELAKGSDERTKELLKQKLSILGYDVNDFKMTEDFNGFTKQLRDTAEENYEGRRRMRSNGDEELSDHYSESSTCTGEYVDAFCCNHWKNISFVIDASTLLL
uniref:ACB domain-containing protein n=1 Tax=Setaria digitata TaxID=48799 RepID=A0A915Q1G1_9BILA